jgi:Uma2 family endonuclease
MREDAHFTMMLEMPLVPFVMCPARPMTDEQLERFCERQEVLHIEKEPNGDLDVRLIGGTTAGMVGTDVMMELHGWNEASGGGRVLPNVGYFLADGSMRGPRLSWIPEARFADHKARKDDGFIDGAPAFVVEVVSLQRKPRKWRRRMEMWIRNGVELGWLFDRSRKTVEIYRPGREPEVLEGGSAVEGEGPVAGFVLELGKVWG